MYSEIRQLDENNFEIIGDIKSFHDYEIIKAALQPVIHAGVKNITLIIRTSFCITSTLMAYLLKITQVDGIHVHLAVGNESLETMLKDMQLAERFNVTRL